MKMVLRTALLFLTLLSQPLRAAEDSAPESPKVAGLRTEETDEGEAPTAQPIAPKRSRALPFRSVIYSIDEEHRAFFHMGKHKLRKVYILPETRFFLASGEAATVEDLRVGADIRGSYRQRPDQHYDAVTIKIGTKERN